MGINPLAQHAALGLHIFYALDYSVNVVYLLCGESQDHVMNSLGLITFSLSLK
jgi:hypothetical protein